MIFTGRSFSGRERHCAYLNVGEGTGQGARFARVSAISGLDLPDDGRSVVSVDWDHDGDLDLIVTNRNAPRLRFFRNDRENQNHFLQLRLTGNGTTTSRDGIGARVEIHFHPPASHPLVKTLRAGEGFLGQSSKWMHFGLGEKTKIAKVTVRWPGGASEDFTGIQADQRHFLTQGAGRSKAETSRKRSLAITPGSPELPPPSELARIPLAFRLPMVRVPYQTFDGRQEWARFDEGHPVLLTLWSSWCEPCLGELSELTSRHADLEKAGLKILAISVDGFGDDSSPAFAEKRSLELKLPFTAGAATSQLLSTLESLHHRQIPMRHPFPLPTSFLVDSQGRLATIYKGPVAVDSLLAELQSLDGTPNERFLATAPLPGRLIPHPKIDLARRRTETLIRFRLAGDLEASQRFEEAAIHYRGVVDLFPDYAEAHNNLGNTLDRLGQPAEAEEHFRKALSLKPNFAFAHHNLGNALLHQGSSFTSLSSYRKAIELDPSVAGFYFSLANALVAAQEPLDEAFTSLEKALELDPKLESAHLLLGYLHQQAGRREQAIASYQSVLKLNPENTFAKSQLESLR